MIARLAEARAREAAALQQLRTHRANILQVRAALGNPYFYSGRSTDDPKSKAHYTGYTSHEPALQLIRDWQNASHEVAAIRNQLLSSED
jgi:hypothetical protein